MCRKLYNPSLRFLSHHTMTPELRKEASELILHKRGIRINVQLHVIEADEEVRLRSADQVTERLLALWLVNRIASAPSLRASYLHYADLHQLRNYLSPAEVAFIDEPNSNATSSEETAQASLQALHFLSWCAGLLPQLELNQHPKKFALNTANLLNQFPDVTKLNDAPTLHQAIKLRRKTQVMDWSDLLYRLHWAVRHAALTGKPAPGNIDTVMVSEWHRAVNWVCCYDDEDDWDKVSTETSP